MSNPDGLAYIDQVYYDIINIMFITWMSEGRKVMTRKEITTMLFSPPAPTDQQIQVANGALAELVANKKLKRVGGRLNHSRFSLNSGLRIRLREEFRKKEKSKKEEPND